MGQIYCPTPLVLLMRSEMTRLSTDSLTPSLSGTRPQYVPFTVFARVIPSFGNGKRFEMVRDLEKIANIVEGYLDALSASDDTLGTTGVEFDFAIPVKFTFQFAESPARLTIHGNVHGLTPLSNKPLEDKLVISSGEFKTGPGCRNAQKTPSQELNSAVKDLLAILNTIPYLDDIMRIEMAGFLYGRDGVHFPQ